jgi:hypothetical protein
MATPDKNSLSYYRSNPFKSTRFQTVDAPLDGPDADIGFLQIPFDRR